LAPGVWERRSNRRLPLGGRLQMKLNDKEVLVCNCEGTMDIDGKALAKACLGGAQKTTKKNSKSGNLDVASHLCRTQLDEFQRLAMLDEITFALERATQIARLRLQGLE